MTWSQGNIEKITKLKNSGVDTGLAEKIVKSDVNRNYTLDGEITSCEVLLKSFNPKEHNIKLLYLESEENEIDVRVNDLIFEVKRFVMPEVQPMIHGIANQYIETVLKKDRFIQLIVTFDENTGLDTIKEGDITIHKTEGITGVELLIELKMFNEPISKKILHTYDNKFKDKTNKIPIIDIRSLEIPDFDYIKNKIHRHYSKRGYFILFLIHEMVNNDAIPMFFPVYHPKDKYTDLIEKLSNSITDEPIVALHSYSYRSKKDGEGWKGGPKLDKEGYIIIGGKRICKHLSPTKYLLFYGFTSKSKNLSKITFEIGDKRKEIDVEYLKPTWRKKQSH